MLNSFYQTAKIFVVACCALVLSSCGASTSFTDIWKDPTVTKFEFKNILCMAMTSNDGQRRVAEDRMVANILKAKAVASYTVLTADDLKDADKAKAKVKEAGFDCVITIRLVGSNEKTTYVPGSYSAAAPYPMYGYGGYYGYGWGAVYDPGYMVTNTYVYVDTRIFSVADEKLLWSGKSQTVDPSSVKQLIDDIAYAAVSELKNQGLISK